MPNFEANTRPLKEFNAFLTIWTFFKPYLQYTYTVTDLLELHYDLTFIRHFSHIFLH